MLLLAQVPRPGAPHITRCKGPFFASAERPQRSTRAAQWRFAWWQRLACFDRHYSLHQLRHSAVTNIYWAKRDLFLAQRFARHLSPLTTTVYTHPSDSEMWESMRRLPC